VTSSDLTTGYDRILVTGGSGFIGTNLVDALIADGHSVLSVDTATPRIGRHVASWRNVNILDAYRLRRVFTDFRPELVIHLAARTDLDERRSLSGYAANVAGVANVVDAIEQAGSVKRSLFASSRLVSRIGYVPADEFDYTPTTLYGQSKVEGEKIVRASTERIGLWTLLRFTSIWGPWFGVPYNQYFRWIDKGVYVHPSGVDPRKSFGYIRNTVYQVRRIAIAPIGVVAGKTFWVADYPPLRIREWATLIAAAQGSRPVRSVPLPILRAVAMTGDAIETLRIGNAPLTTFRLNNLVTDMVYDTTSLESLVGPLPFDLETGVRETVSWMKARDRPVLESH
jgi:GlcNAc-P-P-Und epimerase